MMRCGQSPQGSWPVVLAAAGLALTLATSAGAEETIIFFHQDALGSVRLVTGNSGEVLARHDYLPFGEELPADQFGRASTAGYGVTDGVPQRFTGKERDTESGLDYFGARYYSGPMGRFATPDDILNDIEAADPQSWNRYAYVRNNPLNSVDPDGRAAWKKIWRVVRIVAHEVEESHVVKAMTNKKAAERTAEILDRIPPGGRRSQRVVRVGTEAERKALGRRLSPEGKLRPNQKTGELVESAGGLPEHSHPKGGPYEDVHIQTGAVVTGGVLTVVGVAVAPYSAAVAQNPNATEEQVTGAALWDTAMTIDPIFITDAVQWALDLDPSMLAPQQPQPAPTPQPAR